MMKNINTILKSELFDGFTEEEALLLLSHSGYKIRTYSKNNEINGPDDIIEETGIILLGTVDVIQISPLGKEEIVAREHEGEMIGQAFNITLESNTFAHFRAATNAELLFINLHQILTTPNSMSYYIKFVNNITKILASTNIQLNKKIQLLTQKTLRDKLMIFFEQCASKANSKTFTLNFNREQLAQYICSERSSVSRELGYMQDEGLIAVCGKEISIK